MGSSCLGAHLYSAHYGKHGVIHKTEVHSILQRTQTTCSESLAKFRHVVTDICVWTHRQTDKHTHYNSARNSPTVDTVIKPPPSSSSDILPHMIKQSSKYSSTSRNLIDAVDVFFTGAVVVCGAVSVGNTLQHAPIKSRLQRKVSSRALLNT